MGKDTEEEEEEDILTAETYSVGPMAANTCIFAQCHLNVNAYYSTLGFTLHSNVKLFSELNI